MDDEYFLHPIDPVMRVLDEFKEGLKTNVGAQLQPSKCELWSANRQQLEDYLLTHPECKFKVGSVDVSDGNK